MIPRALFGIPLVALGAMSAVAAGGGDPTAQYGKHLAGECTSCHRLDGAPSAIPSILGKPEAEFIELLNAYREGRRTNPVMVSVAKSLDGEQMAALAAYFGTLPKPDDAP